jgi:hypothetical protein
MKNEELIKSFEKNELDLYQAIENLKGSKESLENE